jgi:hypothetical protein
MKLQGFGAFRAFIQKRQRLLDSLDASRSHVDRWIEEFSDKEVTLTEVALLEGLLSGRRDVLSELAALDDSFITSLLTLLDSESN